MAPARIARTASRMSAWPVIMMAGRSTALGFQSFEQLEATHPRHPGVDDETTFPARMIGLEEGLAARVSLDRPPFLLE